MPMKKLVPNDSDDFGTKRLPKESRVGIRVRSVIAALIPSLLYSEA